ncbi:MAG TPA: hypothetical protein DEA96_12220 [Leptospiraceae bacterium]|nr:hypothetical protein [Spirochaetaceae bacterium]HBS05726.1 hypothetical protein [Leptospiraceae bacterium]|tara:strand:+ start:10184 stop:10537 length:354 start_codon:yes stop_codon:yes gene_type:complete
MPPIQLPESKLNQFVHCINAGEYYEAHEVMEEIWILNDQPRPSILQSFIQIAASLEHMKRENINGARALAMRALHDVHNVNPLNEHRWDLATFLSDFERYAAGDFKGKPPNILNITS